MLQLRPLAPEDLPALQALLLHAPTHNLFQLSALREFGLGELRKPGSPGEQPGITWATGALRHAELVGALVALRGTGGVVCSPDDAELLDALAQAVIEASSRGDLNLLSGHASVTAPLLRYIGEAVEGPPDRCRFCELSPDDLRLPPPVQGFGWPRRATGDDMERLVDFYITGFYSLAHLPTREAWRARLQEQLDHRTLFLIEDHQGRIVSAALSSAEGGGAAMLGGVATLREHRGRGLSPLCVGALCEHLFDRGYSKVALFYLIDNLPAERVYAKLGFVPDGEWLLVPVGYHFAGRGQWSY